jgi:hypothetical protein
MRGSRMRDRRPPSCLWNCGTRAARLSRHRAIRWRSTLPSLFLQLPTSCTAALRLPGSASTRPAPLHLHGPSTSDLLPTTTAAAARPRTGALTTALPRHIRPSAISFVIHCYPRSSGRVVLMRISGCSALVDTFLRCQELYPRQTQISTPAYRFSILRKYGLSRQVRNGKVGNA